VVTVLASLVSAIAVGLIAATVAGKQWETRGRARGARPSGVDVTPFQYAVVLIATAVATYLVVYALTGLVLVAVVPAVVVAMLPRAYLNRRRARRLAAVREAWPDGLRDILSSIRSGASLPAAVENVALFGPEPLRDALHGFGVYARSLGVTRALEMVRDDLADPTSDRVIEVLVLAYERGGAVVTEILGDLADATTRDGWLTEQIRTESLEQKINARVVFVLPWIVLVAMTARPGPFRDFYSSSAGVLVALIGGALSLIGIAISTRLGAQPAEQRVFGEAH
jgi:tight adherence protein B